MRAKIKITFIDLTSKTINVEEDAIFADGAVAFALERTKDSNLRCDIVKTLIIPISSIVTIESEAEVPWEEMK
tara:strand:- start:151 stop:369 length:219 start_codon:yes stop_codon:yes gene_type:complete